MMIGMTCANQFLSHSTLLPYVTIALTIVFLLFFQGGISPITWTLLSEIFPVRLRGLGMGLATFCLWIANFFVAIIFPILLAKIGLAATFMLFTVFNIISLVFAVLFVPETQGRSLEEIELDFKFNHKFSKENQI